MIDLMNLGGKELAITGLKMLVANQIGPKCTYCEKAATDVFVDKIVGDIFRIEIIPICEKCKEVVGNGY